MINDRSLLTSYRRLGENKNIFDYIHVGIDGAILGAWDFLFHQKTLEQLESMILNAILNHKCEKFIENLQGKFWNAVVKSGNAIKKALATKYLSYLSRQKYSFICKTQKSAFEINDNDCGNIIKHGDKSINIKSSFVSHHAIEELVKNMDISEISFIPGYSGVARIVTALTTMIVELHMKVPTLKQNFLWFNGKQNHFIIEF